MATETRVRTQHVKSSEDAHRDLLKHIDTVRERLNLEFVPTVPSEVVSREVAEAAAQFDGARVTTYVPVLVNRQVRLRLRELVSSRH